MTFARPCLSLLRTHARATAIIALAAVAVLAARPAPAEPLLRATSAAGAFAVEEFARGLEHPWSIAFLPDGRLLVTERPGRLRIVSPQGRLSPPVAGVPKVHASGQGGLLDVVASPSFDRDRTIFLSYAEPTPRGARTAVARAELQIDADGASLRKLKVIFAQKHDPSGSHHWGSRLVFARDGTLFVTLGDRYAHSERAQDLGSHFGKVVRIRSDGTVPADNPFVNRGDALPEIWSLGHRNPQGGALHPETGRLWTHEHGPQGGDEVNVGKPGANHGWPVITYGRQYGTGFKIGEGTSRPDIEPPLHQWTPSIAPSGMAFYTADRFPGWRGSLFVGSLKFRMLSRLELDGERVVREERLLEALGERIRDVRQGPDGLIYLATDNANGRLLRLVPAP